MFAFAAFVLIGSAAVVRAEVVTELPYSGQPASLDSQQALSAIDLDNLVAPVALYPDPLLSQMLAASTYPLEVVEASQWLKKNKSLHGQALIDAAKQQPWDSSVQALVAVPDALAKLNEDIHWTTDLGNAFLAQESDVMNAVQRMRTLAQLKGKLASTKEQKVTAQQQSGKQLIIIEPADPQIIYVPTYDPYYVWGPPVRGYYPPLFYPAFGFGFGIGYDFGFIFADWGGWGHWGWIPNWFGNTIFINSYFFDHYGFQHRLPGDFHGSRVWTHDPDHRQKVPYRNNQVAERFSGRSTDLRNPPRTGNLTSPTRTADLRTSPRTENASPRPSDLRNPPRTANTPNQPRTANAPSQPRTINSPNSPQTGALRNPPRTSDRPPSATTPSVSRPDSRIAGLNTQVYRSRPTQAQSSVNQPRQQYQPQQQYRSTPRSYSAPRVQQFQVRPQQYSRRRLKCRRLESTAAGQAARDSEVEAPIITVGPDKAPRDETDKGLLRK